MFAATPASIALSSYTAAARPVAIVLRLHYEMQCGWPGPTIAVTFPALERMPSSVPRRAVLVDGKEPTAAMLNERTVSLTIARPAGVMCDVIGPGIARVAFSRAAGFGNPRRPGTYAIVARHGAISLRADFLIH